MTGELIKQFLVGLSFGVDDSSLEKFNKSIKSASLRVTALYASIKTAAAGIVYGISKISQGFEEMGYEFKILAPAINKALILRQEMMKAYRAAGINFAQTVRNAVAMNVSITKTRYALEAIYKSVASRFFTLITQQSDTFRKRLYENMPKIQASLEKFVRFVFKAFEATVQLGTTIWSILTRVYDFFEKLHKTTDGYSTIILGFVAAWKILNLSFIATPFGAVLTGLLSILALYDDFMVFKEGGKSLFDWSGFIPVIDSVTAALAPLNAILESIFSIFLGIGDYVFRMFTGNLVGAKAALTTVGDAAKGLGGSVPDFFDKAKGAAGAIGNWGAGVLGSGGSDNSVNQKVTQQTNINVQGSADALSTAKAVASEQNRVNYSLGRNLRGATR